MEEKCSKLIRKSKKGDKDSLFKLITNFRPLINKYMRKLKYEDAENDLIEHFIKIIKKIPEMDEMKQIQYIKVCIKNQYILLSKKRENYNNQIFLDETIEDFIDDRTEILSLEIKNALNSLSERDKKIIVYRYVYGYGDQEISKILNLTRQAIHKSRKKGLNQLKYYLE